MRCCSHLLSCFGIPPQGLRQSASSPASLPPFQISAVLPVDQTAVQQSIPPVQQSFFGLRPSESRLHQPSDQPTGVKCNHLAQQDNPQPEGTLTSTCEAFCFRCVPGFPVFYFNGHATITTAGLIYPYLIKL